MAESDKEGSEALKGVVKWFNDAKGFGFIQHTSGKDVFVHYSVIETEGFRSLKDGEEVEYELKEGEKGLHALRVHRLNPPPETDAPKTKKRIKYETPAMTGKAEDTASATEDSDEAIETI